MNATKQAPALWIENPDPKNKNNPKKYGIILSQVYAILPKIYNEFGGRKGNPIKLITTLLLTKGDGTFKINARWICDRCGFPKSRYIEARQELINKGWLELKDNEQLIIHTKAIMGVKDNEETNN